MNCGDAASTADGAAGALSPRAAAELAFYNHVADEHGYRSDASCDDCDALWAAVVKAWRPD